MYRPKWSEISRKEEGYLVGFYIGDGYGNYNPSDRHYKVSFSLDSRQALIKNKLKEILLKLELNPYEVEDKRYNAVDLRVNSKKVMLFLKNEEEDLISNKNIAEGHDFKLGLLSGFIDAEGYVKNGEISLAQKDKSVLNFFKEVCGELGVETRKFWSEENPPIM